MNRHVQTAWENAGDCEEINAGTSQMRLLPESANLIRFSPLQGHLPQVEKDGLAFSEGPNLQNMIFNPNCTSRASFSLKIRPKLGPCPPETCS